MIIKNFFDTPSELQVSHAGNGLVKSVKLFDAPEFSTNLSFINYSELSPGTSIGYHEHGDDEEVYVILEGKGVMTVNGQSRPVSAGDVILNKPGWSHGLENDSDADLGILVFEVSGGGTS